MNSKLLLLPSFYLVTFFAATAAEYFASPDVYDDSGDGSAASPCSIVRAVALATADNDIVTLKSGVYDMTQFTASGVYLSSAKKIVLRSETGNREDVVLAGGGSATPNRCLTLTAAATVKDLTISNFYYSASGAAINSSKATVRNCLFADNAYYGATHHTGGGCGNGGYYYNCRFERNSAGSANHQTYGGALFTPSYVSNCVFVANSAKTRGGAVSMGNIQSESSISANLVVDSYFTNNTCSSLGGAVAGLTVSNCVFSAHTPPKGANGGAAYMVIAYDSVFCDNICSNGNHYLGGGAAYGGKYYGCEFTNNKAVSPGGHQTFGGAIYLPAVVSNCTFTGNYSAKGGGAVGCNGNSKTKTTRIYDSYFTNNTAYIIGGAIYGATVYNCEVVSNVVLDSGYDGGGAYYVDAFNTLFEGNILTNCCTTSKGVSGGGAHSTGSALNCIYRNNSDIALAKYGNCAKAGACYAVAMTNCLVVGNLCSNPNGAVYGGSAVWASQPCVNCTIVSNHCLATSSFPSSAATGNFINCIIVGNDMSDVYCGRGSPTTALTNCVYGTASSATIVNSKQVSSIDKVKFESVDPSEANSFRLRHLSPARDAGYDVGLTSADRDLDGNSRVIGAAIDIGCYEAPSAKGMTIILR